MFNVLWSVLLVLILAASPALAEETIVVGATGAVLCEDADELKAMLMATITNKKPTLPKTCISVKQGDKITARETKETSPGVKIGLGYHVDSIGDRKTGTFILSSAVSKAVKHEPKSSDGRTFKPISPSDVRATPSKWAGRDIEFRNVNVYWVDDNDVRFVTTQSLTVFGKEIRASDVDKNFLKDNCETSKEAFSAKCRVTIRFQYQSYDEDKPDGYSSRTVITSDDVEVIRSSGSKRKR